MKSQTKKVGYLMVKSISQIIQRFPSSNSFKLLFLVFFFCPNLWASMDAIVIAERAVVYSDQEMTSPLGFIARGKKVVVGEIARNKAQVYPIVISGKIAYIRALDISTEKESMDSTRLVAERFQKNTDREFKTKYVLSYFTFNSTMDSGKANKVVPNGTSFNWQGFALKGEVLLKKRYDVQIMTDYMTSQNGNAKFTAFELGAGLAYRLIDRRRMLLRAEGQFLAVPFSTFSYGNDFRVKSYGYTIGAALNFLYLFTENWGAEVYGGLYRTSFFGFDAPAPYTDLDPVFTGARLGLGLNYSF